MSKSIGQVQRESVSLCKAKYPGEQTHQSALRLLKDVENLQADITNTDRVARVTATLLVVSHQMGVTAEALLDLAGQRIAIDVMKLKVDREKC